MIMKMRKFKHSDNPPIYKDIVFKLQIKEKLVEHKQFNNNNSQDIPEIRNWKWSDGK